MSEEVLRVENVAKRFGPVTALRDVSLHLKKGEVLGLLGDNGAGKSTLIKIISGFQKPDDGRLIVKGEETELKSVDHARSLGIDCVYQDLALVNELSVTSNMFLRRELVRSPIPLLARRRMQAETRAALDEIGVNVPRLNVPVARLRAEGRVSIIMIAHNYVHVLESCDRVNLIQDGVIAFDKPTAETSIEELTELVVSEYRRARMAS